MNCESQKPKRQRTKPTNIQRNRKTKRQYTKTNTKIEGHLLFDYCCCVVALLRVFTTNDFIRTLNVQFRRIRMIFSRSSFRRQRFFSFNNNGVNLVARLSTATSNTYFERITRDLPVRVELTRDRGRGLFARTPLAPGDVLVRAARRLQHMVDCSIRIGGNT